MRLTPKTEAEIASENLWPAGDYDFEVAKAEDAVSKSSGADMIVLTLRVFNSEGKERTVKDYLLEAMPGKLRHFCAATGLLDKYQAGEFCAADCEGKAGRLNLKQTPAKGDFLPKNDVRDYIVSAAEPRPERLKPAPASALTDTDQEIPF